jgi:hypothetical protein
MSSGNFTNITASSIGGPVVASTTEVSNSTITTKVVTPSALAYLLARPPVLGSATANKATFTDITANSLSGTVIASLSDVLSSSTSKIVSAKLLKDAFDAPLILGGITPNKGSFSSLTVAGGFTLQGDTIQASEGGTGFSTFSKGDLLIGTGTSLAKLAIGSSGQYLQADSTATNGAKWVTIPNPLASTAVPGIIQLANTTDASLLATANTAVSPSFLKTVLGAPPIIGGTTSNDGRFKTLTAASISGTVVATGTSLTANNQVITPSILKLMFESPATVIGGTTPNSGKFNTLTATSITTGTLNVTSPPWQTIQFASNAEANAGLLTSKAVTPANLANLFANPIALGTTSANSAKFTNVTITGALNVTTPPWVSVSYAANTDVTAASATNKALCPANITTLFASPKPLGTSTPSTGNFTNVTVSGLLTGTIGSAAGKNPAFVSSLTADTIAGSVVAVASDITTATSNAKVLTPGLLSAIFASPKPIGATTAAKGTFTDLVSNTLTGLVVASDSEIKAGTVTNKVITPKGLYNFLASRATSSSPGSVSSTFATITAGAITGDVIADVTDIHVGVSDNQVVTPSVVKAYFASPGVIGSVAPNSATFTVLTFETVQGTVIADDDTLAIGSSTDTLITPAGLRTVFDSPYDLGSVVPANGKFTTITANAIGGNIVATLNDAVSGTLNNKVIVPNILKSYLASPPAIGGYIANSGKFTTLTFQTIAGEVIASVDDITNGLSNQQVVTPYALTNYLATTRSSSSFTDITADSLTLNSLQDSASSTTGALIVAGGIGIQRNAVFGENVTIMGNLELNNPLSTSSGGTGIGVFQEGDILYANADGDLSRLPISSAGQILTINNGVPVWGSLPTTVNTFTITGTNSSIDSATGALIVNGGGGFGGDVNIGGSLKLGNPLEINSGGTGIADYSPGDILYADNSGTLTKLTAGNDLQVLTLRYGLPVWRDPPSATSSSGAFTTTELQVTATTDSTSTTTGAAVCSGGVGIGKSVNIGSDLHVGGVIGRGRRTVVTTSYTLQETDYIIGVRTINSVTLTLPLISALTYNDKIFIIKAELSAPNILLQASGSDTIDGLGSIPITGAYNSVSLYTDGVSEWFIY